MTDERKKKPGLAFYATIVVVLVLVLYPLSFGPACWITSHMNVGADLVPVFYRPLTLAMSPDSETMFNRVSVWYALVGAPENWMWGAAWDPASERFVGWVWVHLDSTYSPVASPPTPAPPYAATAPIPLKPGDLVGSPEDGSGGNLGTDE